MNIIDYVVLGICAIFILIACYKGFIRATIAIGVFAVSILAAWIFTPMLAQAIADTHKAIPMLLYYSESKDMLGSVDMVRQSVTSITPADVQTLVANLNLPYPLDQLFMQNIINQSFAAYGITTMGDYLAMTCAHVAVNVFSFCIIFLFAELILKGAALVLDDILRFPVLRHGMDIPIAGLIGFLEGALMIYVLFMGIPVLLSFIPLEEVRLIIDESAFSKVFYYGNLLIEGIKGTIG